MPLTYYVNVPIYGMETTEDDMEHHYKGWIIERTEAGHFNMRPATEELWTDAAELLREAKTMIDRWTD